MQFQFLKPTMYLYWQWLQRDIQSRYRGSVLGLMWPLVQPIAQMLVFTLVFYQFFQIRWPMPNATGSALEYGLNVFAGLTVFNFFAEIMSRSPVSVLSHPNLVTKVRFPLALLPGVTCGSAFVHIGVGVVLLGALSWSQATWGAWLALPAFLLPLIFYGLAISWVLASLTVYLRDIAHAALPLTNLLLFLSPIFYPSSSIPESLRWLVHANPVAWGVDSLRALILHGVVPDWSLWAIHGAVSLTVMGLGYALFRKISPGFADVL